MEQDEQLERMRKEQELRKKKEKEDSLTLEQTKEQVCLYSLMIVYLYKEQVCLYSLIIVYLYAFSSYDP